MSARIKSSPSHHVNDTHNHDINTPTVSSYNNDSIHNNTSDTNVQSHSNTQTNSLSSTNKKMHSNRILLASEEPKFIFDKYDTDKSGLISFDEFRAMLPELGIRISLPKTKKYFDFCDTDQSGQIDFEEFQVSMFLSDPNGNPIGFSPNSLLSPKDAFEMFDKDGSGKLDEDEFFFLLQYMEIHLNEEAQDKIFRKYDTDKSGYIEYNEFKKIWVRIGNTKKELIDRGITIPKFASKIQLVRMLEKTVDEEEQKEKIALAEAERWRKWQAEIRVRKTFISRAKYRAQNELSMAMDAAGQVYTFGSGTINQFGNKAKDDMSTKSFNLICQEKLIDTWNNRLGLTSISDNTFHNTLSRKESIQIHTNEDDFEKKSKQSGDKLRNKKINTNTIALWGRRPQQIAISESVMFCLCESGQIYAWGGNNHWWHTIEPDSYWQNHWRGDSTARSKKLLCTEKVQLKEPRMTTPEIKKKEQADKLKMITQYFGCWRPPSGLEHTFDFIRKELIPLLQYERVKLSLDIRGKPCEGLSKLEMIDILAEDIHLEKTAVGERIHHKIRDLELEILDLYQQKKKTHAKKLRLEVADIWNPLRILQKEQKLKDEADKLKKKTKMISERQGKYDEWTNHILNLGNNGKEFTPRGKNIKISMNGITPRAGNVNTPRGYSKAVKVIAGANHAGLIHQNGELYMWGTGIAGRLGLDDSEGGNPLADVDHPTLVTSLKGKPIVSASCGQSHSAAICSLGNLYVWGSCQTGKLGLGSFTEKEELYCSIPTRLNIPNAHKVTKISCGASHTSCIGTGGRLFVWGCGNGGRLGLGQTEKGVQHTPRLLNYLSHETFVDVSCGCYQTIALTAIMSEKIGTGNNEVKVLTGGKIYVAGPANVLGMSCFEFTRYSCLEKEISKFSGQNNVVKQVSAGFRHQSAVTAMGELLCWGNNIDGCCGQDANVKFIKEPSRVSLFSKPCNIALQKPCRVSSVYENHSASLAVDGNVEGDKQSVIHTQVDPQPFCEVDLEDFAIINKISIWNRVDETKDIRISKENYSQRLFPCWIIVSQLPFPDGVGGDNLKKSLDISVAKFRLKEIKRKSTFILPKNTIGRYVRVQLESFNTLHLAQIEVFGSYDVAKPSGAVSYTSAGKNVTAVVIKAIDDTSDIDSIFQRAATADTENATILGQYETYIESYKNFVYPNRRKKKAPWSNCPLCTGNIFCEICLMKSKFKEEISAVEKNAGRALTLDEISDYLLQVEKPPLNLAEHKVNTQEKNK